MLRELLRIIDQDGLYNPNDLAKKLDTSPELVKQMLLQLESAGRIKKIATCQSNQCSGCPLSAGCKIKNSQVWSLKI